MDLVDVEGESVLTNIFRDAFQDSYDDNPELSQYLSELSSYGISRLNSEPHRLAEEKAQILDETRSLAFHNYKTFIQTADCCKDIFEDFQIIETHVESVLHKLPDLTGRCKTFLKEAQDINASRKTNNLTLLKYPQLLELLELPQLVDTCVRNEYYEETLELAEYVKRLEKKHSSIPIMQKIVEEVKGNMQQMLTQLLQQLRSNIQLPVCLRVLGYLRRMSIFTEVELRIKFLQARDAWFHTVLQAIPRDEPYQHISKTIEVSRVHLFDIITQYRAIFSDDEITFMTSRDPKVNEAALFHSWVLQKISQFLTTLEEDLGRGVGGRLDSLFGQCMYFGLSFSRVGADFRALVVPIFHRTILQNFTLSINKANQKLHEMLQSYTLLGSQSLPSNVMTIQTGPMLQPPMSLLEFPPLAAYCNNLLSALNDLRVCTSYALVCDITEGLTRSLSKAVELIVAFHRFDETTFNEQETQKFGVMCKCFTFDLVPHLNRCLQHIFNPQQLSSLIGISILEQAKHANLGMLDVSGITEPLSRFVPAPPLVQEAFVLRSNVVKDEEGLIELPVAMKADLEDTSESKIENVQQQPSSDDEQKSDEELKPLKSGQENKVEDLGSSNDEGPTSGDVGLASEHEGDLNEDDHENGTQEERIEEAKVTFELAELELNNVDVLEQDVNEEGSPEIGLGGSSPPL